MKNLSKFALLCVVSMFGFNVMAADPAPVPTTLPVVKQEIKKDEIKKDEKKDEIKKDEVKK